MDGRPVAIDPQYLAMKKRKHKKQRKQHTPLAKHAREGKTLIPPLNQLNTAPLDWQRDFLPEHLWISALAVKFGLDQMSKPFLVRCTVS